MPITTQSTDYTGRQLDVNIAYKINPNFAGPQEVNLRFGTVSTYCAGVQKLVNRYIIALFTALGSQPNYATFGTNFLPSLIGKNMVTALDAKHTFNLASWSVVQLFRNYQKENPGLPTDEQINTASLADLTVTETGLTFRVNLLTLAGEKVQFLVPLPLTTS